MRKRTVNQCVHEKETCRDEANFGHKLNPETLAFSPRDCQLIEGISMNLKN